MRLDEKQIAFLKAEKEKHEKALEAIDEKISAVVRMYDDEKNAEIDAISTLQLVIDEAEVIEEVEETEAVEEVIETEEVNEPTGAIYE